MYVLRLSHSCHPFMGVSLPQSLGVWAQGCSFVSSWGSCFLWKVKKEKKKRNILFYEIHRWSKLIRNPPLRHTL